MKKTLLISLSFALLLLLTVFLIGCGGNESTSQDTTDDYSPNYADEVRVLTLKGPTGMGMSNVWNEANNNPDSKYKIKLFNSPDLVKEEIILGEYDIAALPTNVAAALYNSKKADLQVVAVNTLGVLHIVENGNTVNSIQDLKGKTIHMYGKNTTPEYILRYVLKENGIDPDKDVTFDFAYSDHAAVAAGVVAGTTDIALLPEPNVTSSTMGESNARIALDLTEEWGKVSEFDVMQGCIVVRREFAQEHPEQLAEFLDEYKASVQFVNENVDISSEIIANLGIIPKAALAKQAIPRCNIVYIDGTDMKQDLSAFLNALYEVEPTSIGGKNPDEGFYYQK